MDDTEVAVLLRSLIPHVGERLGYDYPDYDGGVCLGPIVAAVERLARRRSRIPNYLDAAWTAYQAGRPFSRLALYDAMVAYCMDDDPPQYAWDALLAAERCSDLCDREALDWLGPDVPRVYMVGDPDDRARV